MTKYKTTDTMVLIKKTTRAKLKELRITERESYDEIINRLINTNEGV